MLLLLGVVAAIALIVPSIAAAQAPTVTLKKQAPGQALLGTQQEVSLVAENPAGGIRGYNLSFRDVLPKGVNFVGGSAGGNEPRVLPDKPGLGETTLLFENVADLSANSKFTLSYKVEPTATTLASADNPYTNVAEDFLSERPRRKQKFDANGVPIPKPEIIGTAKAEATTRLTAIEITKEAPRPEGEIMRGVHEHQIVYTLKVKNNSVGPTEGVEYAPGKFAIEVEDWLPAGLEFLGCGTEDHTTNPQSNPNSKEEWPGSGPINQEPPTAAPGCTTFLPYYVKTEETEPPGKPKGVYTHVKWRGPPAMAIGAEFEIPYVAGIPIFQNSVNWRGPEPSPEAEPNPEAGGALQLIQTANLNNNTGPETKDEEPLVNVAQAKGVFDGTEVSDEGELERTAENLAIQKKVTPELIGNQQISTWTLDIETSEYRFVNDIEINDLLPNGLCPLGKENYEGPPGGPVIEELPECDPATVGGKEQLPTYEIPGVTLGPQPAEYTRVEEQPDGTFKIHWDKSTFEALGHVPPSKEMVITFETRTRTDYQENFRSTTPVLTGDSWTNHVDTNGTQSARCLEPGEDCTAPGALEIDHEEPNESPVIDKSEASQHTEPVTILKTVRENDGKTVPTNCNGPQEEYVKGLVSPTEEHLPKYRPGDEVCWTLRVNFASDLFSGHPIVTDFIPTDEEFVPNSERKVEPPEGENDIEATFVPPAEEAESEAESLEWNLGNSVAESKVFEWRFRTKVKKSPTNGPEDISGNLMKFVYENTLGQTFPLRDRAEIQREEPLLKLGKEVAAVNGNEAVAPSGTVVKGGDLVTWQLNVSNEGNLAAQGTEVWDVLPPGISCTDVVAKSISSGGLCAEGKIVWTGVAVAEGASVPLTFEVKVPIDVAPGHTFTNEAGITRYGSPTNSPTEPEFEYVPGENINPEAPEPNAEPAGAEASMITTGASLAKTAKTETSQGGNGVSEATIGEIVDYEVTATIPAGSTLYGTPTLKDAVPSGVEYLGEAEVTLNGAALPAGWTFTEGGGPTFEVTHAGEYVNPEKSGDDLLVLKFKARVKNIAANQRKGAIVNHATFGFEGKTAGEVVNLAKETSTPIVEPVLKLEKTNAAPGGKVRPGEPIKYTVTASVPNEAGVSTANVVHLSDPVPAGMKVVNPGKATVGAGPTLEWVIEKIEPGQSVPLEYELEVEKEAPATSVFANTVTGTTQSLPDVEGKVPAGTREATFKEGAYEAAKNGYEAQAKSKVQLIGAEIKKEVSPLTGTIGTPLTYTVHLKLPPNIKFFNTTIVDTLPEGVAFDKTVSLELIAGASKTPIGERITEKAEGTPERFGWYFGNLPSAEISREIVVVFQAHIEEEFSAGGLVEAGDNLTNHVVGLYNGKAEPKPTKVPTPGPGSGFTEETPPAEAHTEVVEPKVTLGKTVTGAPPLVGEVAVQPGTVLTYTLTVGNTGTSTAYEVEVADTNPTANLRNITPVTGAEFLPTGWKAGDPLVWTLPKVEVGKPVTLTYTAELAESEELENDDRVKNAAEVPLYFGLPKTEREAAKEFREYEGPKAAKELEVALPKVAVTKTTGVKAGGEFLDSAPAEVGVAFPWRIVVKNESAVAGAEATTVEDVLPPGWKYVKGSTTFKAIGTAKVVTPAFNPAGETTSTLTWANIAELPPTAAVEVLFKAEPTLAALANATDENVAVGTFQDLSGASESAEGPYEAEDEAFAELLSPELTIEKTPDGAETVAGSPDHYDILVENHGTGPAGGVEVEDVLSAGQKYVGPAVATPSTGFVQKSLAENTPAAGETTVVWTIASIPAGKSVTIEVPIKTEASLKDGKEVSDVASVSSPQQLEEPSDGGSFEVKRKADLSIEKTANRPNVNAGEDVSYELVAKNLGPSDASGVAVTDELPAGTKFISATTPGCTLAGGTVTCVVGNLKVGEERTFEVEVEVFSATITKVENTAEIAGEQPDPNHGNDKSTVETPIGGLADLIIHKTGPSAPVLLGNTFGYTIEVRNEGPSDAGSVVVADPLPTELEFVGVETSQGSCAEAGGTLTCELGTMVAKGTPVTITLTVKAIELPPAGELTKNTATVSSATTPKEPLNQSSTAETNIVPAADLTITKTAPATVAPDGTLTYGLHVENHGPSIAHKAVVTDPLPVGVTFVSASEGCAAAGTVVTCAPPAGELAVNGTADFQVTVHVPFALGGQPLTNTATVGAEEGDPHPEDNTSTVTTTVGPAADLSITKTMGKAEAGKPLTYTLAVTNHGPSTSSAVTVSDTLPAGTTFKSAAPSQGTCSASGQTVTCQLGALASGGSAQVSITVEVGAAVTGRLRNSAKVEGPEPDPNPANNESSVEGPVTPAAPTAPNLKVVKTADTSTPTVGTPFHYDVAVSNMGGAEAKNVKVVDTLNGPVQVLSIEAESGKCEATGSKISCTIPSIPVGKTVHITYTVVAEAAGPLSNTASAQASNGEVAPGNNHAVKSVKAKAAKANFSLTKTALRKVVAGGEKVGFTITLRNGPTALVHATVCDRLPAALVFVKAAGASFVKGEACWQKKFVAAHKVLRLHLTARAVKGGVARRVRNVASATAENAPHRSASASVRIKPVFAGAPGGVTG